MRHAFYGSDDHCRVYFDTYMGLDITTKLIHQNATKSPLGWVAAAGFVKANPGVGLNNMRVLGSYALVYLLDGRGQYTDANGLELDVRAGDALFLFPELAHRYGPGRDDTWDEFYMVFDGPVFDLWREESLINAREPLHHLMPTDYWLRRFQSVLEGENLPGQEQSLSQVAKLQQVLADILAHEKQKHMDDDDRTWLSSACAMLKKESATDEVALEDVAGKLQMSYASFRKKFARLAGMPPAKYRMKLVIDQACEMIHQRHYTNKELAEACGFCDEFHFSRTFKRFTGVSPKAFRGRVPHAGGEETLVDDPSDDVLDDGQDDVDDDE